MKNKNRTSLKIIEDICQEYGICLRKFSDDWVLALSYKTKNIISYGYTFGINCDSINYICKDKVAMSDLLKQTNIPYVHHFMYPQPKKIKYMNHTVEYYDEMLQSLLKETVVIKPNSGTSGIDVYKCNNIEDAIKAISIIHRYDDVAISKYYDVDNEYRAIALDGNIILVYEKKIDNWIHNLSNGAIPELKTDYPTFFDEVADTIYKSMDIKLACYDFIISNNNIMILEINGGLMMDNFASFNKKYYKIAKDIYFSVIDKKLHINKNKK